MTTQKAPVQTGAEPEPGPEPSDRVWTIPNAISALRIVLIVVFVGCLALKLDAWAIAALAFAGVSDFFDGYLARKWNQVTKLGRLLDPAADRLMTLAMVIGLPLRGVIPWWFAGVLIARDVVVGLGLLWGARRGVPAPQVTFPGKSATFAFYLALPLAYLSSVMWEIGVGPVIVWDSGYAIGITWAVLAAQMYWLSGIDYLVEVRRAASVLR